MQKSVLTAKLAAAALALVALPSAPAQADTPGCVTVREYRAVKRGWTNQRVTRKFDTAGRAYSKSDTRLYKRYRACNRRTMGEVYVYFKKRGNQWRVTGKERLITPVRG